MGSYFNQQSDRKKSVKKKNFKKVTPTKHDERKKKEENKMFRGGGKHFLSLCAFFFFTLVQFSSFNVQRGLSLKASCFSLHPPTSSGDGEEKTVCCELRFSLNINSGLK